VVETVTSDAVPIAFVHGVGSSWRVWRSVLGDPGLVGGHRLIAFDLRGHGTQPVPEDDPAG